MKRLLLIPVLFLFPSCGALATLSQASGDISKATQQQSGAAADFLAKLSGMFGQLQGVLDLMKGMDLPKAMSLLSQLPQVMEDIREMQAELKQASPEAFAKADTNKDGKVTGLNEILLYLLGAGGAGSTAIAVLLAKLRARMEAAAAAGDAAQQKQLDEQYDLLKALELQLAAAKQAPKP